jgi:dipeptidyl aminopeptidase/acylaminoacyl peptidase
MHMNARLSLVFFLLTLAANCQIVERKIVDLTALKFDKQVAKYAVEQEFAEAKSDAAFRLERLIYNSGGVNVSAYLYAPKKTVEPMPVIVFVRGGYVVNDQAPVLLTMFRRLARSGFIVLAPMLRGSDGMPGHDEMGGADLDDLHNAIQLMKQLSGADGNNVFLYGESRGAMMTYFALRDQWPVRAAAVFGGLTEIGPYLTKIDPSEKFATTVWPNYASQKAQILKSRSALEWPEKLNAPILIMHGGNDEGVSPLNSLRLAEKLTDLGKEYSLHIFAGDNHILAKNRVRRDEIAMEWFRAHLFQPTP